MILKFETELPGRLTNNAVMDLAKIISDLEYQRVYLENSAAESNPLND